MDLKFPRIISDGAQDLISKLLRHKPTDRLSLQSVIDHPWVRSNSRRVLPPICPIKKSWAHLACLPYAEGCFNLILFLNKLWALTELQTAIILAYFMMEMHTHFFIVKSDFIIRVVCWQYVFCVFIAICFLKLLKNG